MPENKEPREGKPPVVFEWAKLTEIEQIIMHHLCFSESALNMQRIYSTVAEETLFKIIREDIHSIDKNWLPDSLKKFKKEEIVADREKIHSAHITRRETDAIIQKYRHAGVKIPVFTTIKRTLNDFVALGWIERRDDAVGKSNALYYLTEKICKNIRESEGDSEYHTRRPKKEIVENAKRQLLEVPNARK